MYIICSECQKQFLYTKCSPHVMEFSCIETMNNLSSYCGLVDAKISASDKDLPVVRPKHWWVMSWSVNF